MEPEGLRILSSSVQIMSALADAAQPGNFEYSRKQLLDIPGIGPCTAECIGALVGRDSATFPASDLILKRIAVPGDILAERALLKDPDR